MGLRRYLRNFLRDVEARIADRVALALRAQTNEVLRLIDDRTEAATKTINASARQDQARIAEEIHNRIFDAITEAKAALRDQVENETTARQRQLAALEGRLLRAFDAETSDLRQIGHLAVRTGASSKRSVKCVFLVHAIESFDALADIHKTMIGDARFTPIVATINRKFPGDADFGCEEMTSRALKELGVPHLRLGMEDSFAGLDILRTIAPDIIFKQSQWENDVPQGFSTRRLNFARLCVVPYAMSLLRKFDSSEPGAGSATWFSFDQDLHRFAWRIFCETEFAKAAYSSFAHGESEKFIVSGYPKFDRLREAKASPGKWPLANGEKRRFRVIWAPHHSVTDEWLGFAVFPEICQRFLEFVRENGDVQFVLKPHPALFANVVDQKCMTNEAFNGWLAAWSALSNCCVEMGPYRDLFAASDLMVSDGISFLAEYQIFDKPLIFFDSGRHMPFNELGDIVASCAHRVASFDGMSKAILEYASGAPWPTTRARTELHATIFPNGSHPASKIIIDNIAQGFELPA